MPLWAVHISDGVLTWPWLTGGFALAGILACLGSRRIRDEEIPRVAVLTAVFYVASLIHVRVPPTSVHLLLNGLVGLVLGWRAALAIPVGLFLQAALFSHGGFTTLGINSCIMVVPALLAWQMFTVLQRVFFNPLSAPVHPVSAVAPTATRAIPSVVHKRPRVPRRVPTMA